MGKNQKTKSDHPTPVSTEYVYTQDQLSGIPDGLLKSVTVATGRASSLQTTYEYYPASSGEGSSGRLQSVTYASGAQALTVSYSYDDKGNVSSVTDELGNVTEYRYDDLDRLVAVLAPDPDGVGPGRSPLTRYDYDAFGNVTAVEQLNHNPLSGETTAQVTASRTMPPIDRRMSAKRIR